MAPEVDEVTRVQFARFSTVCRPYAPIYRQGTLQALKAAAIGVATMGGDTGLAYGDVRNAWNTYLSRYNQGRGVVLIGHSQGTILLQRLLAGQIDGQADQRLLVAAFLAGDPSLPVPRGATFGGLFKHIPVCTEAAQTGCVYVWGSYFANDNVAHRLFGHNPPAPLVAACANPAAPDGGVGELKPYFEKPRSAPDGDPPWLGAVGQLSAQCVADDEGNVLRVTIQPGRFAGLLRTTLRDGASGDPDSWGLHGMDMELTQGNVLDRITQESTTWLRNHTARSQ
jgi:hypothetical protein